MKNIVLTITLIGVLFCSNSCTKDFEEINKNPFFPTQTDIGPLFNTVVASLRLGWNEQFYLHNEKLYEITQLAAKTAIGFDNVTIGTEEVWKNYYRALGHIKEIERRFVEMESEMEPEALNNVRAQLKILMAYKTFRVTDLFGDMPFFDAGLGFQDLDLVRPKFDTQEEIYKFLLDELKWAEENINPIPAPVTASGAPYVSLAIYDNLFYGDLTFWRKFGNSLRLRHAIRMVEKDPSSANVIIREILENDLPLIEKGEDIVMSPALQDWRNQGVNWTFREHKRMRMGSNIWHLFSENDNKDGSGIFDIRAEIFFETNNAGEWAPFPQVPDPNTPQSGGIPYQQHRDGNYTIKGAENIYSPFNYYLVRDEEHIPEIIMTAAEIGFLKAEAHLRGLGVEPNSAIAEGDYTLAVANSVEFWQNIVKGSQIWVNAPDLLSGNEVFTVANHPRNDIFSQSNKLELIYTQRFIDSFRQPWEAYALLRRTNGATPHEGDLLEHYRFPYPPSESINNPDNWENQVSGMGEDSERVKVWWMQ